MTESNPYSASEVPPKAATSPAKAPQILRDATHLVVRQRWVELPKNCVVCNAAESGRLTLKVRNASKLMAALGMFGAFVYFAAPSARLRAGLCREHLPGERRRQWIVRGLLLGALAFIIWPMFVQHPEALLLGIAGAVLLLNIAFIYTVLRKKLLTAYHSDFHFIWIDNVSPAFLSQFPEVTRPDSESTNGKGNQSL